MDDIDGRYAGDAEAWRASVRSKRTFLVVLLVIFVTLAFITIQFIFIGDSDLQNGVNGGVDVIHFIQRTFLTVAQDGDAIEADGLQLLNNVTDAATAFNADPNCNFININLTPLENAANQIGNNSVDLVNKVQPILNSIDTVVTDIKQYAILDRNIVVGVIYAVIVVVCLFYYVCLCVRSKIGLQLLIGITEIIVIVTTVIIHQQLNILYFYALFNTFD